MSKGLLLLLLCGVTAQDRLASLKREAIDEAGRRSKLAQEIVDSVFSFSELGFQEFKTSAYLTGILEKNGFRIERGVAGMPTAWVATWGAGKPVIGLMSDIDGIPRASQKPGVAYHAPMIEGAPGHGEGHNSGQAVNIVAALAVKKIMERERLPGTLRLYPGVAEELVGAKAYFVRAGLLKELDVMLFSHVSSELETSFGPSSSGTGLISVEYTFHGRAAHAAGRPWDGRSALDAVELMNSAWNMQREHLRTEQRSHYVITNGGDQPNVVPSEASVWYYFRELDYPHIQQMYELASSIAQSAANMTRTTVTRRVVGSAWPVHMNKPVAEAMQKNIDVVGMPEWSEADQALARALQKEIGAKPEGLKTKVKVPEPPKESRGGGSDDIGDVSWNLPTVTLRYPANIPNLPGHAWPNAVAMATPLAHKGVVAGAKAQAATVMDLLLRPELIQEGWKYFREVQTKDVKYTPLISATDQPAVEKNRERMEKFLPELRKLYYDPSKHATYLEQLGIKYPTVREP